MFQFFSSFGASTTFEKCRLEVTTKTFEGPSEQSLRNIINTFSGQDPQTKSQIAYATIIKKLLTSDSKNNWIYVLKNLIIFDRIVEENLFLDELSALSLPNIDNFKEQDNKNVYFDSERVIKNYWKLIKQKSIVLNSEKHIFCIKRSQRTQYLSKLSPQQTLKQIESIQSFFAMAFDFVDCISGKRLMSEHNQSLSQIITKARLQFSKSKLLEYIYSQILNKLMLYYSCQLQCNNNFLLMLSKKSNKEVKEAQMRKYKRHIIRFKQNSNEYIKFVEERKHIQGFQQLNYKELNPFQSQDILKIIDQFIAQANTQDENPVMEYLIVSDNKMKVEKKPMTDLSTNILIPRIQLKIKQNQSKISNEQISPFTNWVNGLSGEFPQKQVMTVDLIMQIKQNDDEDEDEYVIEYSNRQSCQYDSRDTNINSDYILTQKLMNLPKQILKFKNIFSKVTSQWN